MMKYLNIALAVGCMAMIGVATLLDLRSDPEPTLATMSPRVIMPAAGDVLSRDEAVVEPVEILPANEPMSFDRKNAQRRHTQLLADAKRSAETKSTRRTRQPKAQRSAPRRHSTSRMFRTRHMTAKDMFTRSRAYEDGRTRRKPRHRRVSVTRLR